MTVEDEIRQVSEQFYAALNRVVNGDPRPMMEVWSHGSYVATMISAILRRAEQLYITDV